jgi:hypothetical protein
MTLGYDLRCVSLQEEEAEPTYMTISRKASDTTFGAPEFLAFVCSNTVNIYRCMGVIDLGRQSSALFV